MPALLHILTQENDPLAAEMISRHRALPECRVEVADLTQPQPDYAELLDKIFAADSVQVW